MAYAYMVEHLITCLSISSYINMEVLTAFSQANRNQSWMNHGGSWLAWLFTIALGHFILISMPFFSTPTVWTLTHVLHNLVSGQLRQ